MVRPAIEIGLRRSPGLQPAILAIFVVSGAAGLIYEVVWARQLVLVFGNTSQAISAILAGYFGGLAIGSAVGGSIADRVRSPLRMYGLLELALVVVVLATPISFELIREAYRGVYGSLEPSPGALAIVRFGLAIVALAPATILMGATLPALTRSLTGRGGHLSDAFGRLYAANTVGAIVGTLAAGLVLIELLGLRGALLVGAGCSGLAGILALAAAPRQARQTSAPGPAAGAGESSAGPPVDSRTGHGDAPAVSSGAPPTAAPGPSHARLALGVAFASGLTSLGYQVLWTRLLAAGSGGSTYVFTLILAIFLVGLAVGAMLFNALRPRLRDPIGFLAVTQVVIAVLVVAGLTLVVARPPLVDPGQPLAAIGGLWQSVLAVVLPATIVMGLALPAASALLPAGAERSGGLAGRLLAVNTVGAIAGALAIPFVVVPWLGSPGAVVLLALANLAVAVALLAFGSLDRRRERPLERAAGGPPRRRLQVAGLAGLCLVLIATALARPGTIADPTVGRITRVGGAVDAAAEDEIAAVFAGRIGDHPQLWVGGTSMTLLTIDANLMPILPLIARPTAERALIVAFGMGSAYRTALVAGLRVDAVELVPSVPGMLGWFHADAIAVLADPNGRIIVADGRNHLELTTDRYDLIVTDPPPPIESSGASVISSLEYYRAGRARLTPGGVMLQWVPYPPGAPDLADHIRTFAAAFDTVLVLTGPGGHGVFMLGSDGSITLDEPAVRAIIGRPGVLENLREPADSPADSIDGWVDLLPGLTHLRPDEVAAAVGEGPLVTDDAPVAEYVLLRRAFGR